MKRSAFALLMVLAVMTGCSAEPDSTGSSGEPLGRVEIQVTKLSTPRTGATHFTPSIRQRPPATTRATKASTVRPNLRNAFGSALIRTDYTDNAAWTALVAAARTPTTPDGFLADFYPIDDASWNGITVDQLLAEVREPRPYLIFLADTLTMTHPEHPILAVDSSPADTGHQYGQTVRVIPSQLWNVESNAFANTAFEDYIERADPDGIFRGR